MKRLGLILVLLAVFSGTASALMKAQCAGTVCQAPATLPISYAVPSGPTYVGGFAELPGSLLAAYGFHDYQAPVVPAGKVLQSWGAGRLVDGVVQYPDAVIVDPPAPVSVTPWQARQILNRYGLRTTVETIVATLDQDARDGWQFANEVRRDNPLLNAVCRQAGMTTEQIDQMFREAGQIQ